VKTLYTETDLVYELREDQADGDIVGRIHGRAVPYGEPTTVGGMTEVMERDAFDPEDVIGKPLAYRHGEPIGVITAAENQADGLYIDADVINTTAGRDAAVMLRTGASKGLSVGFNPITMAFNKTKDAVRHTKAALIEVSLTHMPAYPGAAVTAVREETNEMTEVIEAEAPTSDMEAREQIAQLRQTVAALEAKAHATGSDIDPELAQFRSLGEYVKAVKDGQVQSRALDVSNLADAAGLVPPVWFREISGVLDRGRPCISAIGGPTPVAGSGMTVNWPYFDGDLSAIVSTQASENTEINSVDIDIKKGTATLLTYAAGNRLTFQVIERTDPSYVTAHQRIMVGAWGTETDYAFQAGLWANGTNGMDYDFSADTTGATFREAVFSAAVDVQSATGQPAEVVYVNSAVYKKIGGWTSFMPDSYPVSNVAGTFNARTLNLSVAGLPIVLAREFATDETEDAIVTNRAAAGWLEDGPRFASADVAANLGREVAIYGYAVMIPYISAGIVKIYNQA
jgi:HK97 family phage prohead protease